MVFRRLFSTSNDRQLLILRFVLGFVFLAHGLKKTFGTFNGAGFHATMQGFTQGSHHFPVALAFLAIMAEFLGGIGLLVGAFTRIAAFSIACNMLVAIATTNLQFGLFVNWAGDQKGEGIEFHLLVLAMTIVLMSRGEEHGQ